MTGLIALAAGLAAVSGTMAAGPIRIPPPIDYPPASLKAGEHGRVGYVVTITARGRVRHCRITTSSGFVRLDRATCSLLSTGTASPAMRDGQPVDEEKTGTMNWDVASSAPLAIAPTAPPPQ